jgi:hypothetical protein
VGRLNRSAYLKILTAYDSESPGPDGIRHLALIIALEISENKDELEEKDLGEIDETIVQARPHVLDGPGVWEIN